MGQEMWSGQTVGYWLAGKGAWMLVILTSYKERRGAIKVSHQERGIWSTEFREHFFVLGPTKDRISRQVTWQRAAENKEKCNKTTQPEAIQLWEGMSPRVHLNRAARARGGRGRDIVKHNRSEEEWSLLFRQQGVHTHFASLCTLCCSWHSWPLWWQHIWQLSSPKDCKWSEARVEPISITLFTQLLITDRGSIKFSS